MTARSGVVGTLLGLLPVPGAHHPHSPAIALAEFEGNDQLAGEPALWGASLAAARASTSIRRAFPDFGSAAPRMS